MFSLRKIPGEMTDLILAEYPGKRTGEILRGTLGEILRGTARDTPGMNP